MRVELDGGAVIELGVTEAAPTINLIDYSRRETDDFGVTTVVPRAFARQMSVRIMLPTADVDAMQRQLAALRATPAQWIADDRFESLSFRGFYKDFAIDLAIPPVSYCTLTIEGLAEQADFVDPGTDPATDGRASTLQLLQPALIDAAVLKSSTVAETDYPYWAAGTTYPVGSRVIRAGMHRIFESAADGNVGNDPTGTSGQWIDIAPTNRWAMFDQALGSVTQANDFVTVVLAPYDPVNALALLDVTAAAVRVQAADYDRTLAPAASPGMVTFLDLPESAGEITVTVWGGDVVSIGTLLLGRLVGLGTTEASPTAAITDYSRKETDDFGEVTLVERAWAKRMSVRAQIDTAAVDIVADRVANVRATPCLWIGAAGLESLSIYGFFKDFSIEVGQSTSIVALSVEGLSTAAKLAPLVADVEVGWSDVKDDDPAHPKPADGATVGAGDDDPVGGTTAAKVIAALMAMGSVSDPDDIVSGALALIERTGNQSLAIYEAQLLGEARKARFERLTHFDGVELSTRVRQEITERVADGVATVIRINEIEAAATDGVNSAMATIAELEVATASAIAAETLDRQTQVSQLRLDVDGDIADVQAAIALETSTRVGELAAEAALREALAASFATELAQTNAAVLTEQNARASGDAAEATAREALAATLSGDIADVSSAVETEATARAAEDIAIASLLSAVQTTVDGHTASVLMLSESVDGLRAQWGVRIVRETPDGPPKVSGIILNDNGEESRLDVLADYFGVTSDDGAYSFADGRQIINGGSVMTISGRPFGSTNQFVEWTGPVVSFLEECTEANALKFVKINGQGYNRGGIIAGDLRASLSNPSLGTSASIAIGPLLSNGNEILVNASYSMTATLRASYPATIEGRNDYDAAIAAFGPVSGDGTTEFHTGTKPNDPPAGSFTMQVKKAAAILIAVTACNGSIELFGSRPVVGDASGFITWTYSYWSSVTTPDPDQTTDIRNFSANFTRSFSPGSAIIQSQYISVTSTEWS